jgi:hypothetical protein
MIVRVISYRHIPLLTSVISEMSVLWLLVEKVFILYYFLLVTNEFADYLEQIFSLTSNKTGMKSKLSCLREMKIGHAVA